MLCKWVEVHGDMKFYYVAHVRDSKVVYSYFSYASPFDSNANPLASASSLDASSNLPFTSMRPEENPQSGCVQAHSMSPAALAAPISGIAKTA